MSAGNVSRIYGAYGIDALAEDIDDSLEEFNGLQGQNPYKQAHTQSAKEGDIAEEPLISWSEVDAIEEQARKEKEQDEPILAANARRLSDAIKKRQLSL
ncbi:hypothetical protein Unana1_06664 [Umbelopsis nana]